MKPAKVVLYPGPDVGISTYPRATVWRHQLMLTTTWGIGVDPDDHKPHETLAMCLALLMADTLNKQLPKDQLGLRPHGELDRDLQVSTDEGNKLSEEFNEEVRRVADILLARHYGYLDKAVSFLKRPNSAPVENRIDENDPLYDPARPPLILPPPPMIEVTKLYRTR